MLKSIYPEAPLVGTRHVSSRRHHGGARLRGQAVQPRQCPTPPPIGVIGPAKDPTGVPPLELPQPAVDDDFPPHPMVTEVEEYSQNGVASACAKSGRKSEHAAATGVPRVFCRSRYFGGLKNWTVVSVSGTIFLFTLRSVTCACKALTRVALFVASEFFVAQAKVPPRVSRADGPHPWLLQCFFVPGVRWPCCFGTRFHPEPSLTKKGNALGVVNRDSGTLSGLCLTLQLLNMVSCLPAMLL
ncbi:hypothetical protein TGDOM2_205170 [Toxoplasma gondii GAB2-2007-GAL-DOM2]|uniref:Uncharacterized protein n=3 Tax=Toxoplasma gondii TaxID=5811 RepID=V5BCT7_TOXGV|nr:hypothetical protein TGVEG_205170 [Toxoplasma gondii VEG]KFG33621.1 hypothetical protein TGP89_205170 [Toxoplasma gondii p89]KFG38204.1 hypothetical protein TGDOM2_205170 [Toxoplasma gondii GAB2-2007-GAL-DOM2]